MALPINPHSYLQAILDGIAEPIVVINRGYGIEFMNRAAKDLLGLSGEASRLCHDIMHGSQDPCVDDHCPLVRVCDTKEPMTLVHEHFTKEGEKRAYEIFASPLLAEDGAFLGIIQYLHDITGPVAVPPDVARALAGKGLLPDMITSCAWCRKVRDEKGRWEALENFITRRTGTNFSHSICPECLKKAWQEE